MVGSAPAWHDMDMRPYSEGNPVRVLWVEASPKGERSLSSAGARAFLDALGTERSIIVDHLDLWSAELPVFGRDAAIAKFAPIFGETRTESEQAIWGEVERYIEHLESVDALVISCPMWNWSVPYQLKHWLDIICQPLRTFTVDATGRHIGVVGVGKHAQLLMTRSSAYDGRSPEMQDHQQPYLEYLLGGMLGYDLAESVVVEPTTRFRAEERAKVHEHAVERCAAAGRTFASVLSARSNH